MNFVPANVRGFALIDALITALLLGIGVLSIVALQTSTVQEYRESRMRQYATVLAADLTERIRANRAGATHYSDANLAAAADESCAANRASPCTPDALAQDDLFHWRAALESLGFNVDGGANSTQLTVSPGVDTVDVEVVLRWSTATGTRQVVINTVVL